MKNCLKSICIKLSILAILFIAVMPIQSACAAKPDSEERLSEVTCPICQGTGNCSFGVCDGSGYNDDGNSEKNCACRGTGRCYNCEGYGKIAVALAETPRVAVDASNPSHTLSIENELLDVTLYKFTSQTFYCVAKDSQQSEITYVWHDSRKETPSELANYTFVAEKTGVYTLYCEIFANGVSLTANTATITVIDAK